jgi:hypothetical protein
MGGALAASTARAAALMRFADVPGARSLYGYRRERHPFVLLHANTGSSRVWGTRFRAFVANGFR